ncbi:MAG TPA: LLM class flavin-dependent oxidoreductase [Nitrososphaerales archaeon]|nr:LLM class flavin-dependent oxidoreductase [Nitrososphaerales archaeon]
MKVGLKIEQGGLSYKQIIRLASLGEELGYDSISLGDDYQDEFHSENGLTSPSLDPWTVLSGIALNTDRVKIMTLVTNNLIRHPGLVAKIASTVDLISKGRLVFGIGAGRPPTHSSPNVGEGPFVNFPDKATRARMLDESLQVILKLWTDEGDSYFEGKYYKLERAESLPKPLQKPHPPVLVGGKGKDALLPIVAKYADISNFFLATELPVQECERLLDALRLECEKARRNFSDIRKTLTVPCSIIETKDTLERERKREERAKWENSQGGGKVTRPAGLYGTPEEITEQLQGCERAGAEGVIISFPSSLQEDMARLFAEKILHRVS